MLYPDVAASGSLAAALRAEAESCLGAVPVTSSDSDPLRYAAVASTLPHREPLQINAWSHERRWSIRGTEPFQGLALLDGRTEDLTAVARAARAWHDGAALDDIRRAAPFVHLTGRSEVPDHHPARLTESEWQSMRQEAAELEYAWKEPYQALIEAAYAEPALRALYPFTSHWVLRFSATTRPHLTVVGPCLTAGSDGTYGLGRGIITPDLGRFDTAHEAVALAVRHLPSGLGPVTLAPST
ncbi:DUF6193 family natural product biosynthesis protein [Streptomyces gardneri]|uniref:Uncharacterized protein n=1 Tax=Streptomyces gardneri TaxID=66892 RepID=A0A4Y3RGR8_9ACTN|nr:DUF6193 family natural product biosynthesis protein [Streptomyces gardneri]GEB57001.1 hypothetical protein SGA01_26060 [Streptomyces gardneri]GHH16967.1 hypothetical protein GCM10017674_67550 [Streptomyces gardneri]